MRSYLRFTKKHRTDRPPEFQDDYRYPQEMVALFLREYTRVGDRVFDPFAGFGTTLAAAEALGRAPLGVELLPERVAFTRDRLAAKDAIIHGDSRRLDTLDLPPIDCCMTSPPWTLQEDPQDPLTAYAEIGAGYAAYLEDLRSIFTQIARLMKPGARAVIHAANLMRGDEITTLAWDIAATVSRVLRFEREIVICWEGDGDDVGQGGYDHEYCLMFRKG